MVIGFRAKTTATFQRKKTISSHLVKAHITQASKINSFTWETYILFPFPRVRLGT